MLKYKKKMIHLHSDFCISMRYYYHKLFSTLNFPIYSIYKSVRICI